jgi:uncharacterized protein involved in outer membrane biogenesis
MRKAAYVVAAVVALFLLLAGVLPRVVSLDGMRPRIVAVLEEKTGRKATLSKLSLSILPGIGVKARDLTLSGDPGHESERLLEVPEAELRLGIGALLAGRVEFSRVILTGPAILLRGYPDGSTSISEMSRRLSRQAAPPAAGGGVAPSFPFDSIDVREARVALRFQGAEGPERAWDVSGVTARVAGAGGSRIDFDVSAHVGGEMRGHVSLAGRLARENGRTGPYRLEADGDLFRQDLKVEGRIDGSGAAPEMDLSLSMPKIRMGDLPEIFKSPPALLAAARPDGFGSLSAKLSGTPEALGFEIDADLRKAGWTVMPGLQKFIDMPCTLVVQGHRFPDQVVLSNAELRFPPLLLIGNLNVVPSTGAYEWSASSRIASLAEFAQSRGELLQRWSPAGRLTASGKGAGAGKGAPGVWTVGIDLGEVGFRQPDSRLEFRSLEGHLALTPDAVEFSPLAGLFNGQRFLLRGTLAQGDTAPGPLDLQMAYCDLDVLFPDGDHGRKADRKEAGKGKGKRKDEVAAPKEDKNGFGIGGRKVAFRANLSIAAGRARGIDFSDLSGRIGFEKGVHTFDGLRAKLYGGELSASGRLSAAGASPDLRLRLAAKRIESSELLIRKTSLNNFVTGPLTMNVDLDARIGDFAEFSRTASGEGTVSVSGGRIRGFDLGAEAAGLAGLSAFVPALPVRDTPFSNLSAAFRIGDGKIRTDSLRIDSDRFGLEGSAAFGFDKTVDFVGSVRLPASLSGRVRGAAGRFLAGPGGRIEIPLVVSGALTSPAMAIDSGALAKGAASQAIRGVLERLLPQPKAR